MSRVIRIIVALVVLSMSIQAFAGAVPAGGDAPEGPASSRNAPPFDGGDGSIEEPFRISNVDQLQNMSANRSAHYVLVADVDASATEGWGNGTGFAPIGSHTNGFYGSLDGNDHAIINLTINRSGSNGVALFGGLGRGSMVEDLTLVNPKVNGKYYVGAIVGHSKGRVYGCIALNVTVLGYYYVGGMIGYSYRMPEMDCQVSGQVMGTDSGGLISDWNLDELPVGGQDIGGLIGNKLRGWISGCTAEVDVKGGSRVGGLIGSSSLTNITDCQSRGDVTGLKYDVGGLMGSYSGSQAGIDRYGFMTSCSHAGEVTGGRSVGGLLGSNNGGALEDCHHAGGVTGTDDGTGGLVGSSYGSYANCWAVGDVSGTREVGGLFGQHYPAVSGGGPIIGIMALIDLYHIGDVTGTGYDVGGLMGRTGSSLYLVRCNASGDVSGTSEVGGLIGSLSSGYIEDCMSTGSVRGTEYNLGGLIGNAYSASISKCYSGSDVSGDGFVGGLVGDIGGGSVRDSHSSGAVSGDWGVGGLIANNDAYVERCYSTGRVTGTYGASGLIAQGRGNVYDSYWDRQTSGTSSSQGGVPKTTAQMKMESTFVNWDFYETWWIKEHVSYPFLRTVHHDPFVVPMGEEAAYERQMLSLDYDINISKYPEDNIQVGETFSTDAGSWLSYDPAANRLYGMPSVDDIGTYWIDITVLDSYDGVTTHNVTFQVHNVNDAPEILTSDLAAATEDEEYVVDYNATDMDPTHDTLLWSLETEAGWLGINETTGVLGGTPSNDDVGSWNVTVTVGDGNGGYDHSSFILLVNNVNDAPGITTVDVLEATEDEEYSVTYEAIDVDPTEDTLTWNFDSDASWLSWDGTTLSGTPSNDDVGTYGVEISVSDGIGGEDVTAFSITVANVNDGPVILTEVVKDATEDVEYRLELVAEDVDVDDTLAWSLLTAPDWLSMGEGMMAGTPGNDDVGSHDVSVRVEDASGVSDTLSFVVVVANVNDPPVWTTEMPEVLEAMEGEDILLFVAATDIDVGDTIAYSLSSEPSSMITIDTERGVVTWFDPVPGTFDIEVVASDGTDPVTHAFTIVIDVLPNAVPEIDPVLDREVKANRTLSFMVTGSDDDDDSTVFTIVDGPVGLVISSDGSLVWTPAETQVGNHTVVVALSDWRDTTTAQFKISVLTSVTDGEGPDGDDHDDHTEGSDAFWYILVGLLVFIILALLVLMLFPSSGSPAGSDVKDDEEELEQEHDEEDVVVDEEDDEGPESE